MSRFHRIMSTAHRFLCRGILSTPPIRVTEAPLAILSLVSHSDLIAYLVAVKSLYHRLEEGRIIIVDDGTLTSSDLAILATHLGNPQVYLASAIDPGVCPRYICWRRLLTMVDATRDRYVIQLDSDTLTRLDVPEIIESYRENRSFILGTKGSTNFSTLEQCAERVRTWEATNIQVLVERSFGKMPHSDTRRYVRGSGGFFGLARGVFSRNDVDQFSQEVEAIVGTRWQEWGTEQMTACYLVANSGANATVLPYPQYALYDRARTLPLSAFLHFFGLVRYRDYRTGYGGESLRVIKSLRR